MSLEKDTRHYGIDIVKIIAMFLVVFYHTIGCGIGFPWQADGFSEKNLVFSILEAFSLTCIDLFALATGYLYCQKKEIKYSRIITLWIQVVFWSVVPLLFVALYNRDFSILSGIPQGFLVVSFNRYWYFCAYLILFLLMPFINKCINALNGKKLFALVLIFGILFSLDSFFGQDAFAMSNGLSFAWLAYMYVVGAAIKKWTDRYKIKPIPLLVLSVVGLIFEGVLIYLGKRFPLYSGVSGYNYFLISVPSVFVFTALTGIKLKHSGCKKIVTTLSKVSFAVYLFHLNPAIYEHFIRLKFTFVGDLSIIRSILATAGIAFVIYAAGMVLGIAQDYLFRLIKINKFSEWLEIKFKKVYTVFYNKIRLIYNNKKLGE